MPSLPPRALAAAAAAVAIACAGCGGAGPVDVAGRTVPLALSEYRIAPQAVRVDAGRVVLEVRNAGTVVHRLQVRSDATGAVVASTPPLLPGRSARVAVELRRGSYGTTDPLGRNDTLGAYGTLVAR